VVSGLFKVYSSENPNFLIAEKIVMDTKYFS